jgi:hypothetical protein
MDKIYRKLYQSIMKQYPTHFGVDCAKDSGMVRGDVIIRRGNVVYVRFKTCTPELVR